ncbi:hypothetical protein ACMAZE_06740 [Pseudopelagicola sp. nBUS_20]|uniref:hypothetical protein n=1 Tax=Pseudopelagicola sp. nBUS_20 TaxID=3395317 RepID=UPI003EBC512A
MQYDSISKFIQSGTSHLSSGPIALIFIEDDTEIDSTLRHHLDLGFKKVIAFIPSDFVIAADLAKVCPRVTMESVRGDAMQNAIDVIQKTSEGVWFYYCFNAEYLFYPFCETRTIGEMLTFHAGERRDSMLTYVVDLYASDLNQFPNAVALEKALLDRVGYYALARKDPNNNYHPRERQLDFFGGLRWRFEEHIPWEKRKIDRIAVFRAKVGLQLRTDFTFNDEEYNTYACPWHNNLTAAICSFRTAKALKTNPASQSQINQFKWRNSVPFEWHSRQLLDLGLMEPGQWF